MPGEQPGVVCLALAILGAQQLASQPFVLTAPVSGATAENEAKWTLFGQNCGEWKKWDIALPDADNALD